MNHSIFPFDSDTPKVIVSSKFVGYRVFYSLSIGFLIGVIFLTLTLWYQKTNRAHLEKTTVQTFSEP